jgi:hypothetical protein
VTSPANLQGSEFNSTKSSSIGWLLLQSGCSSKYLTSAISSSQHQLDSQPAHLQAVSGFSSTSNFGEKSSHISPSRAFSHSNSTIDRFDLLWQVYLLPPSSRQLLTPISSSATPSRNTFSLPAMMRSNVDLAEKAKETQGGWKVGSGE